MELELYRFEQNLQLQDNDDSVSILGLAFNRGNKRLDSQVIILQEGCKQK